MSKTVDQIRAESMIAFGRNVRKYRKAMGMTQEELSEAVGVSNTTISAVEKGIGAPSLWTAVAIAGVFGKTLDALIPKAALDGRGV